MRFSEVQHQERALSILRRSLASGRTHHAYLFEGPEGVGKERAAVALAARLLCEDENLAADAEACGACRACRLLASDTHPDFQIIHRGLRKYHPDAGIRRSTGLFLVVDVIRHFVIEPASNRPVRGRRRVFIVRDAERMNEGAQNALLKTLEEPPGQAVFVLVTSAAERLRETIRSRCQRIPFGTLPREFVSAQVAATTELPAEAASTLANLADGRLGAALRWHHAGLLGVLPDVAAAIADRTDDDPEQFAKQLVDIATEFAPQLAEANALELDEGDDAADAEADTGGRSSKRSTGKSKKLSTDVLRDAIKTVLVVVAAVYRDALLSASGADGLLQQVQTAQRHAAGLAQRHDAEELAHAIEAVSTGEWMLDRNVNPQLALEHLAIRLSGAEPATLEL